MLLVREQRPCLSIRLDDAGWFIGLSLGPGSVGPVWLARVPHGVVPSRPITNGLPISMAFEFRKARIGCAFDPFIERRNHATRRPASALNTQCAGMLFWGDLRIDLA